MDYRSKQKVMELDFEKNGMPVRYGSLEIKDGKTLVCYVSAKCVKVGEREITLFNGRSATEYQVVFEWNQDGEEGIAPQFKDGECINSTNVMKLFTNYMECEKYVDFANYIILGQRAMEQKCDVEDIRSEYIKEIDPWQKKAEGYIEFEESEKE